VYRRARAEGLGGLRFRNRPLMPMHGVMRHIYMPSMFIGVGLIALWVHVRFPRLQPTTFRRALVHTAVSIGIFALVPYGAHASVLLLPTRIAIAFAEACFVIPAFSYVLLSWLWLLARVRDHGGSTPRGGHTVRPSAR
jgi:hypothetical protein